MASLTQWTCVWASSRSWWWTGKPSVLQSMGSQRVGYEWVTALNWTLVFSFDFFFLNVWLIWPPGLDHSDDMRTASTALDSRVCLYFHTPKSYKVPGIENMLNKYLLSTWSMRGRFWGIRNVTWWDSHCLVPLSYFRCDNETQRGQGICLMSHDKLLAEQGADSRFHVSWFNALHIHHTAPAISQMW